MPLPYQHAIPRRVEKQSAPQLTPRGKESDLANDHLHQAVHGIHEFQTVHLGPCPSTTVEPPSRPEHSHRQRKDIPLTDQARCFVCVDGAVESVVQRECHRAQSVAQRMAEPQR